MRGWPRVMIARSSFRQGIREPSDRVGFTSPGRRGCGCLVSHSLPPGFHRLQACFSAEMKSRFLGLLEILPCKLFAKQRGSSDRGQAMEANDLTLQKAKWILQQTLTSWERCKAVETALSLRMPLRQIEDYLDYLDSQAICRTGQASCVLKGRSRESQRSKGDLPPRQLARHAALISAGATRHSVDRPGGDADAS